MRLICASTYIMPREGQNVTSKQKTFEKDMTEINHKHVEEIKKIENDTIKIQGEITNNSKKLDIELEKK